jgi:hypothetical protein
MTNLKPKTHLSHEWLTEWGGSEDVTRLMLECLPGSSLSATINFLSSKNRARLNVADIQTTFLQRAPFIEKRFWNYLPLTPLAIESLDLRGTTSILPTTNSTGVSKAFWHVICFTG